MCIIHGVKKTSSHSAPRDTKLLSNFPEKSTRSLMCVPFFVILPLDFLMGGSRFKVERQIIIVSGVSVCWTVRTVFTIPWTRFAYSLPGSFAPKSYGNYYTVPL